MAFIDEVTFIANAGKGGNGVVRWRKEKYEDRGGPWGGDGGKGGDVYIEGVRNISILQRVNHTKRYRAENGDDGGSASKHGGNGEDITIMLPEGSRVTNLTTNDVHELLSEGQRIKILRGGAGGYGNEHFKSSTNTSPESATNGSLGEQAEFHVELRLIAHAGLVGYPNAGKTSLLNALSNAAAKVGDYPFTTLSPNLGAVDGYVIADIPGIIEDASLGRGLGTKFLRHIMRTRLIIHCISCERDDPFVAYTAIRKELMAHESDIIQKPEIVLLTKSDLVTDAEMALRKKQLAENNIEAIAVSAIDDGSIAQLRIVLGNALADENAKYTEA